MSTYSLITEKLTGAGQTWKDLTAALGLPAQYAYNWKGKVNKSYMHRLKGIGAFLQVSVEELNAAASKEEKSVVEAEATRIRNAQARAGGEKAAKAAKPKAPKVAEPGKAAAKPAKEPTKADKATKAAEAAKPDKAAKEAKVAEPGKAAAKAPTTYTEKTMEQLLADLFVIFVGLSHQSQVELINIASQMEKEKG